MIQIDSMISARGDFSQFIRCLLTEKSVAAVHACVEHRVISQILRQYLCLITGGPRSYPYPSILHIQLNDYDLAYDNKIKRSVSKITESLIAEKCGPEFQNVCPTIASFADLESYLAPKVQISAKNKSFNYGEALSLAMSRNNANIKGLGDKIQEIEDQFNVSFPLRREFFLQLGI